MSLSRVALTDVLIELVVAEVIVILKSSSSKFTGPTSSILSSVTAVAAASFGLIA